MSKTLRWGILGTGNIAKQFAADVATSQRGKVVAVGSRSEDTARAFAAKFSIPAAYASYRELIGDRNVDAVYISLPNSMHHEWTLEAAAAGKHVLCEKPIAINGVQAEEMFDAADRAGVKLVEAFMFRSHPLTLAVLDQVRSGAIGDLKMIRTSFCYRTNKIDGNIRFDRSLFGGALMDVGCYCIAFSRLLANREPVKMHAVSHLHHMSVDDATAGILEFSSGVLASFTCGMSLQVDNTAYISGSEGYIEIPVPWKPASKGASYTIARGTPPKMDTPTATAGATPPRQTFTVDSPSSLYGIEADDFARAVLDGSPVRVSRADSVGNMRVLDELREQIGLPTSDNANVIEQS
ncbi:Gfo/Idh/MocA family oxidoreductase [soil metagenome]